MYNKRSAFSKSNWAVALALLAVLVLSTVSPAFAAGGSISTIVVGSQGTPLIYGTPGSASFVVSFTSTGTLSNAQLQVAGLPSGVTGAFSPAKLSFSGIQTKSSTLTLTMAGTASAVSNRPFTVGYKLASKVGAATGSGSLTIGKATLGVQPPLVQDKLYDGTTNAVLNPGCSNVITTNCAGVTGVVNGDVVYLVTTNAHGAFVNANAGPEDADVTGLSLSGSGAGNYAVLADVSTSATINPAQVTVTANPAFKVVGFGDPAFTASYNGFVNGETEAVLTVAASCSVAGAHSVAGNYPITCAGATAPNYTFTYATGTLLVSAADNFPTNITLSHNSVAESLAAGAVVGNLTATDIDSGAGETYSYSLVDTVACPGPDSSSFSAPSYASAGPVPLQTAAMFHYLTKSSYTVCVEVNDGNGGIFDKQFAISVLPSTSTFYSMNTFDGWVLESAQGSKVGGTKNSIAATLRVGDDAGNKQYRSILAFATGSLPDNATILTITLKVKQQALSMPNIFASLGGLRVDIIKPAFGMPTLQLTDFQQAPTVTNGKLLVSTFGTKPDANGWYSATLSPTAFPYLNKLTSTQFRLRFYKATNANGRADVLSLYSGNAVAAYQPQLIITYSVP